MLKLCEFWFDLDDLIFVFYQMGYGDFVDLIINAVIFNVISESHVPIILWII